MPDKILEETALYQREHFDRYGRLLAKLVAEGQKPDVLFITCVDSRIMPEQMLGLQPGDFFVHRNIAASVPPYIQPELGTTAVLEYAVHFLHVGHIIVCGHTQCGGIMGLDADLDLAQNPALVRWVDKMRPAKRDIDFTMRDLNPAERHRAIVERSVVNQLDNLRSYPFIREAEAQGELELHGWVYYLEEPALRYYDPAADAFVL